jgi:hypothetical protein
MSSVLQIKMTLNSQGFSLSSVEHELIRVLDNGLLEIPLSSDKSTRFVTCVKNGFQFSLSMELNLISYSLEYFTTTDSVEERTIQRNILIQEIENIHIQTERALFICP